MTNAQRRSNKFIYLGKKLKLNKIIHLFFFLKNFFYFGGILWGKLTSIKEILVGSFPNIEVLSYENIRLYFCAPVFNDGLNIKPELSEGREYVEYALLIKDAIIYGDSNLIELSQNEILFDLPFYDESSKFGYTNHYSKIVTIKGNNIFYWKNKTLNMEKAIWIGGNYSWNYYHLLYEYAIKFIKLNKLNIPLDIPVLVDQICLDIPQFKELLDIANNKGYKMIGIDRKYRVKAGELIYINCPNLIPPDVKKDSQISDIQFNIKAICEFRDYLLQYSSQKKFPKRFFISRKNASSRRKFNEEAIINLLSEFEFETVFPETLSFADQISLFNQAEFIMGGSGAAFTNLLFCNPNCKVVMFIIARYPTTTFSTIARAVNIDLLYITEEDTNKNLITESIHDPFEIDIRYLKEQLIRLIENE